MFSYGIPTFYSIQGYSIQYAFYTVVFYLLIQKRRSSSAEFTFEIRNTTTNNQASILMLMTVDLEFTFFPAAITNSTSVFVVTCSVQSCQGNLGGNIQLAEGRRGRVGYHMKGIYRLHTEKVCITCWLHQETHGNFSDCNFSSLYNKDNLHTQAGCYDKHCMKRYSV